ncbi:MAG: N-acetylmuramoyl-L-alanine amidase [Candidatus Gastranaerophilales bacterium]|nr:N-acetylmuramoyl-L-alanine amidase [Candidatus Gastranaerophilales bacterium]
MDPGHGGNKTLSDIGAIGPTGIPEKEINLKIANYLKQELEKAGAKVIMTRQSDVSVDLYDRPTIARQNNADVLLSIHNNALPDGKNPYREHGTSVYYYHSHSEKLAQIMQKNLLEDLNLKNNGIHKMSFVLTRPTEPISLLIEVGFMIHPDEYTLLLTTAFQQKTAFSIKKGLEEFFSEYK